ncbi:MAG: hypothetical protein EBZ40_12640 [Gammaproteobacteria bacterium]|nr:hypothetical protein [Gammaproteobacteria bacterium]
MDTDHLSALAELTEMLHRVIAERNTAQHELCERIAEDRSLAARSNGVAIRYTSLDIARERGYFGLLSPLTNAVG